MRRFVYLEEFKKDDINFIIKQVKRLKQDEKIGLKLVYTNCYHLGYKGIEILDENSSKYLITYIERFMETKTLTSQGGNIYKFIKGLIDANDKTENILETIKELRGYYILMLTYKLESIGSEKKIIKLKRKLEKETTGSKYKIVVINDNSYLSIENNEDFMYEYYLKGSNYSYQDYLKVCKLSYELVSLLQAPEEIIKKELKKLTPAEREVILTKLELATMEGLVKLKTLIRIDKVLL
jgi:hypothetical protein